MKSAGSYCDKHRYAGVLAHPTKVRQAAPMERLLSIIRLAGPSWPLADRFKRNPGFEVGRMVLSFHQFESSLLQADAP